MKSEIIAAGDSKSIEIPEGVFFKVRSFSQDGGTERGVVSVTIGSATTNVLTAAIIETSVTAPAPTATVTPSPTASPSPTPTPTPVPSGSTQEVMNSVIIAGPATVTITAGDADAFVTYKKDKNSFD